MRNKIWIARVLALVLAFSSCEKDMTRVADITLNATSMNLIVEEEADLVATISPADADNQKIVWSSEDVSIVEVNSGKVRAIAPGTTNVIAKADDNPDIFAACKITVNYLAEKLTIESETGPVSESQPLTLKKDGSIRLKASIQPQDAAVKKVTWGCTNKDVVTISNPEAQEVEIKAVKTGETDIMVTAAGVGLYATCHIVVIQNAQGLSIEPAAAELYEDEIVQLTATVNPADTSDPITWTSSNEEIATVSEGKVYARKAGKVDITASVGSGDNAVTATCPVTVKCRVEGVSLKDHSLTVKQGSKLQLSATVYPERASNKAVSWISDAPHIASVSETGMLEAKSSGTATITVTTTEGGFKDDCVVTVISDVAGITLNKTELDLRVKEIAQLTATVSPADATNKDVTWTSSVSTVATVDDNGKVTAVAPGEAVICATTKDGGHKASCSVRVRSKVDEIALSEKEITLLTTDPKRTLTANITSADADYTLIWKSDNEAVATVKASGKTTCEVTPVGRGNTTIHVSTEDGFVSDKTVSVTVKQPYTGITLDKSQMSLNEGAAGKLTATPSPQTSDDFIVWSFDKPDIATVDNNGNVTAVKAGTAKITAASKLKPDVKATCTVTVKNPVVKVTGVSVSPATLALKTGENKTITATITPANATNQEITWSSTKESVATVSNGKVTAVAPGEAVICATTKDGGHHAYCTVTVTSPVVEVTGISVQPTTLTLNTGESKIINAIITPANATNKEVNWTSSDQKVATVDNDGKVTAMSKVGTATITATSVGNPGKSATCTVTVTRHVTGVSVSPAELTMYKGESKTIAATITPSNAENKNVSWTSSNQRVATVNANGNVVAHSVGTAAITVTTEDGGHTATCNVTVKEKPVNVTSITLNKSSFFLSFGDSETINATIKPDNATNKRVVWSSSDPTVAKVEGGVVTAMSKEGTVTITATSEDNRSLSATCTVKVVRRFVPVSGLTVSPSSMRIYLGQTKQFTATVLPEGVDGATDKTVIWSVQQGGVAAVDQNGVVTPLKVGTTRVTAKTKDGRFSESPQVIVTKNDVKSIVLPLNKITLKVGETYDLTATVNGNDASAPASNSNVTWISGSTTVATVESFANGGTDVSKKTGRITALKAGETTITVKSSDNFDVTAECTVTVLDGGSTGGGNEGVEFDDWNF